MQNLSFRYTRWVNKRQQRTGHLFQGSYKAILVDAESYLFGLVRYLHPNPVRAGLVEDPSEIRANIVGVGTELTCERRAQRNPTTHALVAYKALVRNRVSCYRASNPLTLTCTGTAPEKSVFGP